MRQFKWSHIRAKGTMMPIHEKMLDRHGLAGMKAEETKFFDYYKMPISYVIAMIIFVTGFFSLLYVKHYEERHQDVAKKAILRSSQAYQA